MTKQFENTYSVPGSGTHTQGALSCDNCHRLSVADRLYNNSKDIDFDEFANTISWQPRTAVSKEFPDVPVQIARAAKEAHEAHSINALMAAILMARTVVEATAKDHGITSGNLVSKIDEMKGAELIRKSTAEAAHEIRHFGNDMAHGDLDDVPDTADAAEVLTLMDEVLNEVYQGPARTERVKNRRSGAEPADQDGPTDQEKTNLVI